MIKIEKHGNIPTYSGICNKCGCQITCGTEDLLRDYSTTSPQIYVICPECGEKIYINSGYFPVGYTTAFSLETPKVELTFNWKRDLCDYAAMVKNARENIPFSYNTYIWNVLADLEDDLRTLAFASQDITTKDITKENETNS